MGVADPSGSPIHPHTRTPIPPDEVLDLLDGLVDRSLVVMEERAGRTRYRFLETVRQYAAGRLAQEERKVLGERHARYYAQLAARAEAAWWTSDGERWLARLEEELDNLRAALRWLLDNDPEAAARLCGEMARYWYVRCSFAEGRRWTEAALARIRRHSTVARVAALRGAGVLAREQADYAYAGACLEGSVKLARSLGDERQLAASLHWLGLVCSDRHEFEQARAHFDQALALHRRFGNMPEVAVTLLWAAWTKLRQGETDAAAEMLREALAHFRAVRHKWGIYNTLWILAFVEYAAGEYAASVELVQEALPLQRDLGSRRGTALSLFTLGAATLRMRGPEAARPLLEEALCTFRDLGDKTGVASTLERMADLTWHEGKGTAAARLLGGAAALREAAGASRMPVEHADYESLVRDLRACLGGNLFERAAAGGSTMPWQEMVAEALEPAGAAEPAATGVAPLVRSSSAREAPGHARYRPRVARRHRHRSVPDA
jgi:tetratricopeptide (TPR) repeat protein